MNELRSKRRQFGQYCDAQDLAICVHGTTKVTPDQYLYTNAFMDKISGERAVLFCKHCVLCWPVGIGHGMGALMFRCHSACLQSMCARCRALQGEVLRQQVSSIAATTATAVVM